MLPHPIIHQLRALNLDGMAQAIQEQQEQPQARELSFEERLTLLVDRELAHRDGRTTQRRLKAARLKVQATLEDVDTKHPRGLDSKLLRTLGEGLWISEKRGVIITGPTGVGKTFIGCALAHQACRKGYSAQYAQTGRLVQELMLAKGDGRYLKLVARLARVQVLILDDWGLDTPSSAKVDAFCWRSWMTGMSAAPQSSPASFPRPSGTRIWAIRRWRTRSLDRVLHHAYRIELKGESLTETRTENDHREN